MADEVASVFGNWLPALAAAQGGTAKKPREQSQSDGQPNKRPRPTRRGQRSNGQRIQQDNINNVVSMLAALSLQQEDALSRVRLDSSHTFHLEQTGPGAILKSLYAAGQSWHEKKSQGVPLPALRTVVFALLITETKARLTLFAQDPDSVKAALERKVMNQDKQFVLQRWNPKDQKLEQDPDRNGLTAEQVHQVLQKLGTLCKDNIITKFNSVRKMKKEPEESEKAVFTVEVALRTQVSQLHGVESRGSADAPTILEKARPGRSTPEGSGCRVSGSSEGRGMGQRPKPQQDSHLRVARQVMRNNSNTCYLNSTMFTVL